MKCWITCCAPLNKSERLTLTYTSIRPSAKYMPVSVFSALQALRKPCRSRFKTNFGTTCGFPINRGLRPINSLWCCCSSYCPMSLFHFFDSLRLTFLPYFVLVFLSIITRIYAYRRRPEAKKFLSYQMALSTGLISFPLGYYLPTFAFQFGDTEAATASLCVLLIILPVLCLFEVASRFAFHRSLNRAKEHIS